jgi:hypothetical protein
MSEYTILEVTGNKDAGFKIWAGESLVADCWQSRYSPLIVAAVNACISINPSNPLAVAKGMGELVKATKAVISMSKYMRIEAEHLDKVQSLNHLIKSLSKINGR